MTVLVDVNNGIKIVLMSIKGQKYIAHSMIPIQYNMDLKTGLIRCKSFIFGIFPRSRLILSPPLNVKSCPHFSSFPHTTNIPHIWSIPHILPILSPLMGRHGKE